MPEHHVRVRDCELSPAPIAHRSGVCPGALWPDPQHAARIDGDDGAAAATDGVDVEGWDSDGVSGDKDVVHCVL